ncbi:MAG: serine/threonine protein kinase [Pirellulales bacterium]|nr:serine/threonine protein kinase [Pirellulales bacterium]
MPEHSASTSNHSPFDPTLDAPISARATEVSSLSPVAGPARHVALVEGSGPELGDELALILRTRLRAAALVLFLGSGMFLAYGLYSPAPAREASLLLTAFHVVLVLVLGSTALFLCARCPGRLNRLRWLELLVFGLTAAFFVVMQHEAFAHYAKTHQPMSLMAMMKAVITYWYALIFTYAIFIPNSPQRAAPVVGLMAAAPVVGTLLARQKFALVAEVADMNQMVEMVMMMVIAFIAAIYGIYKMGALRREAYEARQFGQYRLRERIGAGGMGEVFLAEHQMLKRPCAIKLIRPTQAGDPRALARFEREVRTAARLSHWNSIEIFDYGRAADGTFYYVMEYLPGLSLADLVRRHGPLAPERVVHLLTQTCDALTEAHAMGMIHRDIKPGNIFAAQRGGVYDVAKLLDFGLVRPVATTADLQLTLEGSITGSPLYMSPEQALDESPDGRSDIYSLGAVAYFLLTGRPPFEAAKPLQVLFAHAHQEPTGPAAMNGDVPDDLDRVVLRCLAKQPGDRYQTADELKRALEDCCCAGHWDSAAAAAWWQEQAGREPALAEV